VLLYNPALHSNQSKQKQKQLYYIIKNQERKKRKEKKRKEKKEKIKREEAGQNKPSPQEI
jgi:hypothetical protein